MRGGSLRRFSPYNQRGHGLQNLVSSVLIEGAKESLQGVDVNELIKTTLNQGMDKVDKQALKRQVVAGFKRGAKKGLKRKAKNTYIAKKASKVAKKARDIFG